MGGHLSEGAIAVRRRLRAGLAGPGGVGLGGMRGGEGREELGAMGRERGNGDSGDGGNRRVINHHPFLGEFFLSFKHAYVFLLKNTKQNKLWMPPPPIHGHSPPLHPQPDFSRVACFQLFHYQPFNPLQSDTPLITVDITVAEINGASKSLNPTGTF